MYNPIKGIEECDLTDKYSTGIRTLFVSIRGAARIFSSCLPDTLNAEGRRTAGLH